MARSLTQTAATPPRPNVRPTPGSRAGTSGRRCPGRLGTACWEPRSSSPRSGSGRRWRSHRRCPRRCHAACRSTRIWTPMCPRRHLTCCHLLLAMPTDDVTMSRPTEPLKTHYGYAAGVELQFELATGLLEVALLDDVGADSVLAPGQSQRGPEHEPSRAGVETRPVPHLERGATASSAPVREVGTVALHTLGHSELCRRTGRRRGHDSCAGWHRVRRCWLAASPCSRTSATSGTSSP